MAENKGQGRLFLIPVDETEASQGALDWTLENFYREGDEFYFLHVVSEIQDSSALLAGMIGVNSALMIGHNDEEQVQQKIEEAKHMLEHKYVEKAKSAGAKQRIEVVNFSTDVDSVGQVVATRASELKATAVIIASHKRSTLKEFFIGSVSKYVMKNSPITTILLH